MNNERFFLCGGGSTIQYLVTLVTKSISASNKQINKTQMIVTWCYAMSGFICIGNILCWISNILWDYYWHKLIKKACKI